MLKTVLDHQKTTVKSEGSVCCAEVGSVCAEYPISTTMMLTTGYWKLGQVGITIFGREMLGIPTTDMAHWHV